MAEAVEVPEGFAVGHWTDRDRWTGCTVVLAPEGAVAGGEVRGGGPGTRESDLLSPATAARDVHAVLLTGGSAFGLAAADGVVRWLVEHDLGYRTLPGWVVPLVPAAVLFDLPLGDPTARPSPDDAAAACEAAGGVVERGSVGAGTGCAVGKGMGPEHWTKGGLGAAVERVGEATVCAVAAVNPVGDVVAEDGSVLAGVWVDGGYRRTTALLREGLQPVVPVRESTTLSCVMTDARLTKTEAWLVARAGSTGVARAVAPTATAFDGDVVFCLSSGRRDAELFAVSALAAEAVAAAVRDAVRQATGAPGCPAASER